MRIRLLGRLLALGGVVAVLVPRAGLGQEADRCAFLCVPDLKVEPTVTFENVWSRARTEVGGVVSETQGETVFELIFAVGVPTTLPRIGFTFEAIFIPFGDTDEHPFTGSTAQDLGRDEIRDNGIEIEAELNLDLFDEEQTGGWLSSHFDIVDKFSPGDEPGAGSVYTHKLNFELDTALHAFNRLSEGNWLRNLEAELSLDYVATGLPEAGDILDGELFVDDASPWSISLVFVIPLAPLDP